MTLNPTQPKLKPILIGNNHAQTERDAYQKGYKAGADQFYAGINSHLWADAFNPYPISSTEFERFEDGRDMGFFDMENAYYS